ncbi:hypothetical protein GA0115255_1096713 [Streptomyces sp. Ncost-T6T-2b]|nr:hypothetical protein GA0115255_1096713 [Streptomyces sp. Ncost-T6T-2b]
MAVQSCNMGARGAVEGGTEGGGTGGRDAGVDVRDPAEAGSPAAHLEQALLQAHALIESTVTLHRRQSGVTPRVVRTDASPFGAVLDRLTRQARHSVCIVLSGPGELADTVPRLLACIPDRSMVRVLCSADPVMEPTLSILRRQQAPGLGIRTSDSELRETVVVDGTAAFVRADVTAGGQALVVNDTATVRTLELLFAGAWSRGRKLDNPFAVSPRLRTVLSQQILERLRSGDTDETAAGELNVSLRTYRRYVADIMRELDANSRFQAGVRAVEVGLLSG